MNVKLLTEHRLEFLSLTGGGTGSSEFTRVGSSEFTRVNLPHCWKSHVMAHMGKTSKLSTDRWIVTDIS